MSIDNVVNNQFCIGCGACKLISDKVSFSDHKGIPIANLDLVPPAMIETMSKVCPFSDESANENQIAEKLFPIAPQIDEDLGRFEKTYAFRINDDSIRNSSSGGGATWLLENLFESNEIDKVVHVKETKDGSSLFEYAISYSLNDINEGRKSKYYPVTLAEIISIIAEDELSSYALTAIPCFSKAIRLLQRNGQLKNVKYIVGIFCGHYKSKYFHQFNSLQLGIKPTEIVDYDFRVKSPNFRADDYFMSVTSKNGTRKFGRISELFANSWGYGLFKPKACEFCDDIAGETSDIVFGDAWLNEYTPNWHGTNVVVVRNKELIKFFHNKDVFVESIDKEDVINSQMGNFRHRRGGIIARNIFVNGWKPAKRLELCKKHYTPDRYDLYKNRWDLSDFSQTAFSKAIKKDNYTTFFTTLRFKILVFEFKNNNLIGYIKSECIRKLRKIYRFVNNRKI